MKKTSILFCIALAVAAWIAWTPQVQGFSSLYDSNCAGCHGTTTTCNGCHSHGTHSDSTKSDINITGTTDKSTYAPGETVSVTINGGYRTGWIRTLLFDQSMVELDRSTGTIASGAIAPSGGPGFPVTLSAPAPTTPGTYTWNVAWYGNQYDAGGATFGPNWTLDATNPNHGMEVVATNSFTVAETPTPTPSISLTPSTLNFGSIVIGQTSNMGSDIGNTGTADLEVTDIALCSGTSAEFTWSPPAPFTVTAGSTQTLTVTYAPTDEGADSGCINITSNDPNTNPAVLNLSGSGVTTPPLTEFDFDIQKFMASKHVKFKPDLGPDKGPMVRFRLTVFNEGTGTGTSSATLVGMQNGGEVYNQTIDVSAPPGGTANFTFPNFKPMELGDITWTVTINDNDADVDQATAVTTVR